MMLSQGEVKARWVMGELSIMIYPSESGEYLRRGQVRRTGTCRIVSKVDSPHTSPAALPRFLSILLRVVHI